MTETITAELRVDPERNENEQTQTQPQIETEAEAEIQVEEKAKPAKTFTQDEVDKIIADRLSREKEKAEKQQQEAAKLAKMNAEEKAKYKIEQKEKEIAEREKAINLRELTAEAKATLLDRGLATDLSGLLNYESAEKVKESIDTLEAAIRAEAQRQTKELLKGNAPRVGRKNAAWTKEEILRVEDAVERKRLIAENINLFN